MNERQLLLAAAGRRIDQSQPGSVITERSGGRVEDVRAPIRYRVRYKCTGSGHPVLQQTFACSLSVSTTGIGLVEVQRGGSCQEERIARALVNRVSCIDTCCCIERDSASFAAT